ncbi:MAG: TrmH family RNA methyltransferase [Flavobacteriaceae bacterium]
MIQEITSLKNPRIKNVLLLKEKSKQRREQGLFIIEGKREVFLAIKSGYTIESIYFDPQLFSENDLFQFEKYNFECIRIDAKIYEKVAYRGSTEGIFAVAKCKDLSLNQLQIESPNPLILIAESPEKPGNIGALLRTADAAKIDAVIIADPLTDMYNPNIIRSSVGGVFSTQIATAPTDEVIAFVKQKNISIYSAILQDSKPYTDINFQNSSAIVVGTESNGLTDKWRTLATQCIHIPMLGTVDSMNVSVAAGIMLYEAKRQRRYQ